MSTVLLVSHLLIAIFLVAFILLQRSSGGALDGLGGGNGASSFLTARGTGNFLTKATAILATLFFITSMSLSLYYKANTNNEVKSILEQAPVEQSVPSVPSAPVAEK
ncbi:MAG: preprotein translocase subunit SecG [Alphaproteobacteria bacterium]|jgi:preprotein translocase subunit SecG|nr:preprotein translocase subunit SecG [Alphaproteobacteria bacterium]